MELVEDRSGCGRERSFRNDNVAVGASINICHDAHGPLSRGINEGPRLAHEPPLPRNLHPIASETLSVPSTPNMSNTITMPTASRLTFPPPAAPNANRNVRLPTATVPTPAPPPAVQQQTFAMPAVSAPTPAEKPALTLEQQHITAVDGIVPTLQ